MVLANTLLAALSAVAALATVWLAYLALGKARETVNEAKIARQDAEQAARDAAAERRAAEEERRQAAADRREAAADRREQERDRQRHRLERIGEIVEDIFWSADLARRGDGRVATNQWMSERNRLRHALVGLHDVLPEAASILNCGAAEQAVGPASMARNEVERELRHLSGESG
jgi:hypothetical protein